MPVNVNQLHESRLSVGEKLADAIAAGMGSWPFIIGQTIFVGVWVALNTWHGWGYMWDSYPFILLNLLFSTQAAYAAPIIMMSQNRQAAKDRLAAEVDYRVNQRAEAGIEQLQQLTQAVHDLTKEMHTHILKGHE